MMPLIYISGPYTGLSPYEINLNVQVAKSYAQKLFQLGFAVICPHTMTHNWENEIPDFSLRQIMRMDFEIIRRCDGVLLLPAWNRSRGATLEREYALKIGKPCFYTIEEVITYFAKSMGKSEEVILDEL